MKYLITDLNKEEKQQMEELGLYCYDLRDSDFGNDIASIEKRVVVNRIGSIITNEKIELGDKYPNDFVDFNSFADKNKSVDTVKELLTKDKFKNEIDRGR